MGIYCLWNIVQKLASRTIGWLRRIVAVVLGDRSREEDAGMTEYMM